MISAFRNVIKDDGGATLVEYGLLLALVALAAIAAMSTLGANVSALFSKEAAEL